jgi:hypothetical protein
VSHAYTFTAASTFSATALVTATDRATNVTTRTFTIVRDATPPQVSLSAPARSTTTAFTVTWGASDTQSGLDYYNLDVSVDGGEWQRVLTHTQSTNCSQEDGHNQRRMSKRLRKGSHNLKDGNYAECKVRQPGSVTRSSE